MYNHAPQNYKCPLCGVVNGTDNQETKQSDVFYKDNDVTAFIAPKWWKNNPGHVMVIPNQHFENIYDIPDDILGKVYSAGKKIAIALKKVYKCDGTSMRQHNEPAGNQDMWHFHIHVFPRYINDNLYKLHDNFRWTKPEERVPYANKLRKYFSK